MHIDTGRILTLTVLIALLAVALSGCALLGRQPLRSDGFDCQSVPLGGETPFDIEAGDWNGDGRLDLALSSAGTSEVRLMRSDGKRAWSELPPLKTGLIPRGLGVGDIDGDGALDLTVGNADGHDVSVYRGKGDGTFERIAQPRVGVSPFTAELVDLDQDGHLDIVTVNETDISSGIEGWGDILWGDGKGGFPQTEQLVFGLHPAWLAIADFDASGTPDLAVPNWRSSTLSIFLNDGRRRFRKQSDVKLEAELPYGIAAGDFDGDGRIDLAVTSIGAGGVFVLGGDGRGGFRTVGRYEAGSGVRAVASADLDADGRLDLVTVNTGEHSLTLLRGTPQGTFENMGKVRVHYGPRLAKIVDLDADGLLDIVLTDNGPGTATVLYGRRRGRGQACVQKD